MKNDCELTSSYILVMYKHYQYSCPLEDEVEVKDKKIHVGPIMRPQL